MHLCLKLFPFLCWNSFIHRPAHLLHALWLSHSHVLCKVTSFQSLTLPFLLIGVSGREDDHLLPQLPSDWLTDFPYGTVPLSIVCWSLCVWVLKFTFICLSVLRCLCTVDVLCMQSFCVSSSRRVEYCVKPSCGSPVENAPRPSRMPLGVV